MVWEGGVRGFGGEGGAEVGGAQIMVVVGGTYLAGLGVERCGSWSECEVFAEGA